MSDVVSNEGIVLGVALNQTPIHSNHKFPSHLQQNRLDYRWRHIDMQFDHFLQEIATMSRLPQTVLHRVQLRLQNLRE